jgi:hypothetical protein
MVLLAPEQIDFRMVFGMTGRMMETKKEEGGGG